MTDNDDVAKLDYLDDEIDIEDYPDSVVRKLEETSSPWTPGRSSSEIAEK